MDHNYNTTKITGIVLAGGKSTRMGKDKGLINYRGKTLIEHTMLIIQPLCEDIIISTNQDYFDLPDTKTIRDEIQGIGPMGGLYSALKSSETEINLVIPYDTPFLNTEYFEYLVDQWEGQEAVVPWHGVDLYEPLCALYTRGFSHLLEIFIERKDYKLPHVFEKAQIKRLRITSDLSFYHPKLFYSINRPEDLELLR